MIKTDPKKMNKAELLQEVLHLRRQLKEMQYISLEKTEDLQSTQSLLASQEKIVVFYEEIEIMADSLWLKYHLTKKNELSPEVLNFLYKIAYGSDLEKMYLNNQQMTIF